MAEITTTQSFSDGDIVTATKLNNIQGNASIQPEAITNRSAETSIDQANDLLLVYDASATALKKVSASNLIKAGTASDFPITGNATIGGTLGVAGVSTLTGNTSVGGTLAVNGASTLTGNTAVGGTFSVTGAITATSTINGTTIPTTKTLVTTVDTQTLTNKTLTTPVISSISNTGTLTLPTSTDTLVGRATTDTLTNKTLTTPIISSISNTGTITLPTTTDTLVGRATTDTLTNKTLTTPVISSILNTGTLTLPTSTDTIVGRATTDTLTNKTLTSPSISTPAITGQITASTSIIDVGSGQIYKDASGNVGIGTSSPSRQLSVSGNTATFGITSTAAGGNTIAIDPATTANGGLAQIDCSGSNSLRFNTNSTERLRIASAGQIGIGGANYGTTGQVLTSNGASSAPSWQSSSGISSGTPVVTSGTAIDFTGIPSSAKRISILFSRVATGTSYYLVQLGTSSAINTTDYRSISNAMDQSNGNASTLIRTDGMAIYNDTLTTRVINGIMTISLIDSATNSWVSSHSVSLDTNLTACGGGSISLSDKLTRIRVTTASANTFTAGTLNIMYEG